jgi:hypothetical protein
LSPAPVVSAAGYGLIILGIAARVAAADRLVEGPSLYELALMVLARTIAMTAIA